MGGKNLKYHFLALVIVAIWGITFINTKVLINNGLLPRDIFLIRFSIAYIGIWLLFQRKLFCDNLIDEFHTLALGVTGGSFYFLFENTAIEKTLVNNVSFIVCTAPLITTLFAIAFSKERNFRLDILIGSLLALIGVGLVVFNGSFVMKINPIGDTLALGAAFCWAIYSLIIQKLTSRYDIAFITRKVFFYGLLTIIPFLFEQPLSFSIRLLTNPIVFWNFVFLGVVASLLCFVLWNYVIQKLGALKVSNYIYLNPVFTLIGSFFFLNEPLSLISMIGFVFILTGIWLAVHTT